MAMSTNLALARLPEESWGQRLRRARNKRSLESTAELVSMAAPTSHTSLARLEQLHEAPEKGKLRARAVLALLVYGYEPADFDLSLEDLPRAVDVQRFADLLRAPATIDSPPSGVVSFRTPVLAGV
jgi:hypothetical protein